MRASLAHKVVFATPLGKKVTPEGINNIGTKVGGVIGAIKRGSQIAGNIANTVGNVADKAQEIHGKVFS